MLALKNPPPLGEHSVFFPDRTLPLRAMLGNVGHSVVREAHYNWHGLKRGRAEFSLFQYTLAGQGCLRIGGKTTPVVAGTAMLLHIPHDHHYWLPPDSPSWEFIYVCLHGREVTRLWRTIEHTHGALVSLEATSPSVTCAARIVREALTHRLTDAFAASALAYELTMRLSALPRTHHPHPQAQPALERARQFAQQHLAEPLSVTDLAQQAGMSRYHFSRLFAAHTGLPPASWLTEQRIKEAARLLRGTSLSLKEIAAHCGFPNPNYLSRVFRGQTGMPPATYRRSGS